jgi:hypothetical protein
MRFALDMAPPNILLSAAFGTPAMRWLAQHVYFRKRANHGVSFADFEARLARLETGEAAPPTGVLR